MGLIINLSDRKYVLPFVSSMQHGTGHMVRMQWESNDHNSAQGGFGAQDRTLEMELHYAEGY